jgi:hypothetical protein
MPGLQIQPHSRHISGLAVAFLFLLAAGSFVAGLNHQLIVARDPTRFPTPAAAAQAPFTQSGAADAIPAATPAPDLQLASATPPRRRAARDPIIIDKAAVEESATKTRAEVPPAVDASAAAPDPAPADPKA